MKKLVQLGVEGRKSSEIFGIENELTPRDFSVNISCIIICRVISESKG